LLLRKTSRFARASNSLANSLHRRISYNRCCRRSPQLLLLTDTAQAVVIAAS
jgi:hypothetical protein